MIIQHSIKSKLISLSGVGGIITLAALSVFIPYTSASADSLDYNISIRPSLNISVSSSTISLTLNPSSAPYATTDLDVSVGTNNATGYKLYINADSTNLANNSYSTPAYIETLDSEATGTSTLFPTNKWGYRISSGTTGDSNITDTTGTNFFPFASGAMISSSSTAVNDNSSTLTFASKVNYEKPSGLYVLDFNFKAIPIITTYNMQNMDFSVCTEDPTIVTDSRDGQTYTIAKLADGNCWMLDNLRLDLTDERVQSVLSQTNTNASNEAINYLINGGGSGQWARNGVSEVTTTNSFVDPRIATAGDTSSGDSWNKNDVVTNYGAGTGKIGTMYNYCAASAGSSCYNQNSATEDADYDICPASWRMPTGGANGEYGALCEAYKGSPCASSSTDSDPNALLMAKALSLGLSGSVEGGVLVYHGSQSTYWTSTHRDDSTTNMYDLFFAGTRIGPYYNRNRGMSISVRCMLPNPNSGS